MAFKRCRKVCYVDSVLKENEKDSTHQNYVAAEKKQQKGFRDRELQKHGSTEDDMQRPGAGGAVAGGSAQRRGKERAANRWSRGQGERRLGVGGESHGVNTHAQHQTREPRCLILSDGHQRV
jgi:hypothetical protein